MTSPAPTYPGLRILCISGFDEARQAHAGLRHRALERLGCDVRRFNLVDRLRWWHTLRRKSLAARIDRVLGQFMPDIVLVIGGDDLTAGDVRALKERTPARWVNWIPDTLAPVTTMRARGRVYDHLFVPATDLVEQLTETLGTEVGFLPPAADPSVHRPLAARDQFRANVVFVGTATPSRERLLSELIGYGLAVWGQGWRTTGLRDYCRGELLSVQDYVRAYAGASVGINIHHETDRASSEMGCNQRVFELAAIGTPQVVDARGDLSLHFTEDQDLAVFESEEGLHRAVKALLHDHRRAEGMGRAARRAALARHTYMHRMIQLVTRVVGEPPKTDAP